MQQQDRQGLRQEPRQGRLGPREHGAGNGEGREQQELPTDRRAQPPAQQTPSE